MQPDLLDWKRPAPPARVLTNWTPSEVDRLIKLYVESDVPRIGEIARVLGKRCAQVASKANRLGISFTRQCDGATMRKCLPCSRMFWSESIGNRICPACVRSNEVMGCAYV